MSKGNKGLYFIIIILLVVVIFGGIYYFVNSKIEKDTPNKPNDNIDYKANPYVGGYKSEVKENYDEENKERFYIYLTLRNDGTYTYGNNTVTGSRVVGTYTVNESTIALHPIVSYGSDACYVTKGDAIKDSTIKIIDKKTLEVTNEGTTRRFTYDSNVIENSFEKSWYVINPINGQSPEISDVDEFWTDCTE